MSRHRVEAGLCQLREAAICRVAVSPQGRLWSAVTASDASARLTSRRQASATTLPAYGAEPAIALGRDLVHLTTRLATRRRLEVLAEVARHEWLAINPEPSFEPASVAAGGALENHLHRHGVCSRVLGTQRHDPKLLQPHLENTSPRLDYRQVPTAPMKLIIIDRKVALFPVDRHNYERGYIEVAEPAIVQSLLQTFEQHWRSAVTTQEHSVAEFIASPRERAVIRLLANGYTDAGTARELRISERSVTNIVRSLMDRLGVDNRFQLGIALGTLHAAPLPPGLIGLSQQGSEQP